MLLSAHYIFRFFFLIFPLYYFCSLLKLTFAVMISISTSYIQIESITFFAPSFIVRFIFPRNFLQMQFHLNIVRVLAKIERRSVAVVLGKREVLVVQWNFIAIEIWTGISNTSVLRLIDACTQRALLLTSNEKREMKWINSLRAS